MNKEERAGNLLVHYFRTLAISCDVGWDSDMESEIRDAVRCIIDAAVSDAADENQTRTGVPESALVAAQNEAAMLRQQRATAQQEIDTLRQHLADAIKLISALQGDVRLLRQQAAEAWTERDRQLLRATALAWQLAELRQQTVEVTNSDDPLDSATLHNMRETAMPMAANDTPPAASAIAV